MGQATCAAVAAAVFETERRARGHRRSARSARSPSRSTWSRSTCSQSPGFWFVPRRFLVLLSRLRRLRDVRRVGLRGDDALPGRVGLRARAARGRRDRRASVPANDGGEACSGCAALIGASRTRCSPCSPRCRGSSCSCTSAARSSTAFAEKSDDFARTFVDTGTFGFIPGEPSAYTQPLYGFFLIPVYWIAGRHWWSLGRRADRASRSRPPARLRDRPPRRVAGRRLLVRGAARRCTRTSSGTTSTSTARSSTSCSARRSCCSRSSPSSAASWRWAAAARRRARARDPRQHAARRCCRSCSPATSLWRLAAGRRVAAAVAVARRRGARDRAVGRPQQGPGRLLRDHDRRARALEGEQPADVRHCSRAASWIDDVAEYPPGAPPTPAGRVADAEAAGDGRRRTSTSAPRGATTSTACSSSGAPPRREGEARGPGDGAALGPARERRSRAAGLERHARHALRAVAEPLYMVPLFLLALAGSRSSAPRSACSRCVFFGYETLAAWVFAGHDALPRALGLLRAAARRGSRSASAAVAPAVRARSGRPPRSARCSGPRGSARHRARAPGWPIARAPAPGRSRAASIASASASASPAGRAGRSRRRGRGPRARRSTPRSPAARAPSPRARPCRSPRRATARRRRATPRSPRWIGVTWPRKRTASRRPSSRERSFSPCSSDAAAGDVELARRAARRAPAGTRAAARRGP